MKNCVLCPRECHADRLSGKADTAKPAELLVARGASFLGGALHIGKRGLGHCVFLRLRPRLRILSKQEHFKGLEGKAITIERLAEIFLELQAKGANNINLVTPSHYVPIL